MSVGYAILVATTQSPKERLGEKGRFFVISGWRKYYTQVLDNTFLMNDNNAYLIIMKLLAAVNNKGEYNGTGREMAVLFNLKYPTAYKALLRLQEQRIVSIFATPRGRTTIIKLVNFAKYQSRQQMSKQENKQVGMQQITDEELVPSKQLSKQENKQSGSSGEADEPKLQGSKKPLDKDKEYSYKGFDIFDVQLMDEIKAFIDCRIKKNKGFTQRALDLNLDKLRKYYPDDIEAQRACINEVVAHGWSGIFPLREEPSSAPAKRIPSPEEVTAWQRRKKEQDEALVVRHRRLVELRAAKQAIGVQQ